MRVGGGDADNKFDYVAEIRYSHHEGQISNRWLKRTQSLDADNEFDSVAETRCFFFFFSPQGRE